MSTRASSMKKRKAAHQAADHSPTVSMVDANVSVEGVSVGAGRSKRARRGQAAGQPSESVQATMGPSTSQSADTQEAVVGAPDVATIQRPKRLVAKQAATTRTAVDDLQGFADGGKSVRSRKRTTSSAAQSTKSKKPRCAINATGTTVPISPDNSSTGPTTQCAQAPVTAPVPDQDGPDLEPKSVPPRASRKLRASAIDYEKVLSTSSVLTAAVAAAPSQPVPSSAVKLFSTNHVLASGAHSAEEQDDGAGSDEEGDDSGQELSAADLDDDGEVSESDDDLLERAPIRLEADLVAERPVWSRTRTVQGKGKQRATTESEFSGESEVEEEEPTGSESEYENPASPDEHSDVEVVGVGPAGPSRMAAPVVSQNKAPTKRDLKQALEQPTWRAAPAAPSAPSTSSAARRSLQIWTAVDAHASTLPPAVAAPVAPTPVAIAIAPAAAPVPIAVVAVDPGVVDVGPVLNNLAQPALAPLAIAAALPQQPPPAPPLAMPAMAPPAPPVFLDESDDEGLDDDEPGDYLLVPPANAGGVLPLTSQHPRIKATVRNAFPRIEADLAFVHAFPDSLGRSQSVARAMICAADELRFRGLAARIRTDNVFTRILTAIPNQRVSTFRSTIKKATDAHVTAFYQLVPNECAEKIDWLFNHLAYIYPHDFVRRTIPWNKPYQHPSVGTLLRVGFFTGGASFAIKHAERFSSSLTTRPNELEIPGPMLALVCAAMHASLMEWKTGIHRPSPFSGDAYVDVYNEHITLLTGIRKQNPRAYHTMMHRLFNVATGELPAAGAPVPGANALAQVDVNAMDVD